MIDVKESYWIELEKALRMMGVEELEQFIEINKRGNELAKRILEEKLRGIDLRNRE